MNDNELIAWQVLVNAPTEVLYTCLQQETAEYLRDWCEAETMDITFNHMKRNPDSQYVCGIKFSINECEVLV